MKASLTSTEYFHLAADAMSRDDHHPALIYLKTAVEQEPNHAQARLALSSLYLKLGMVERSVEELEQCASLEAANEFVRLRLAGTQWRLGRQDAAKAHYTQLANSEDAAIRAYSGAMLSIAAGALDHAAAQLRRGLAEMLDSHPLKNDLSGLLYAVFASPQSEQTQQGSRSDGEAFLGAYAKIGPGSAHPPQ